MNAPVGLSASQAQMAALITREFLAAGLPANLAAAAVVNAYAESSLNPLAIGDSGRSVGLFQLSSRGLGAGMTTTARQDPTTNTRRILDAVRGSSGRRLREVSTVSGSSSSSIAKLAALFSTDIERPTNTALAEMTRSALALRLYPLGLDPVTLPAVPVTTAPAVAWLRWGAVAAGALVVGALVLRRSRSTATGARERAAA